MGTGASVPDFLDREIAKTLGGELYSDERFDSSADENHLITKEQALNARELTDCFLSHDWGVDEYERNNHERVLLIGKGLQKRGLIVWLDEDRLNGNINDQMCSGITNATVVIVFVTKKYIEKVSGKFGAVDNCRLEFGYSGRTKGADKIIPVIMEDRVRDTKTWVGDVGFVIGGELYIDFVNNNNLDSVCETLFQRLCKVSPPLKHGKIKSYGNSLQSSSLNDSIGSTGLTKQLITLSIKEVSILLENLYFTRFQQIFLENEVDGETLHSCDNINDIVSLGIPILPKAKVFLSKIHTYKHTGVPLSLLIHQPSQDPPIDPLAACKAIHTLTRQKLHRGDRDRVLKSPYWLSLIKYDWERQPPGYSTDANKSIIIGVSELLKEEDAGLAQLLVIKHLDAEERYRDGQHQVVPAFWGVGFTAEELREIIEIVESCSTVNTLIHREPWLELEEERLSAPWLQETHWLVENRKVVGITASVKCSQDMYPTVVNVYFKVEGERIRFLRAKEVPSPYHMTPHELWQREIDEIELPSSCLPETVLTESDDSHAMYMSYESAVKTSVQAVGFGGEYQSELWLFVPDVCDDYLRISVTTAIKDPHEWFMRVAPSKDHSIHTYTSFSPSGLNQLAYQAVLANKSEVLLDIYGTKDYCRLLGIVHAPSKIMYALKAVIIVGKDENIKEYTQYCRLDYSRVKDEIKKW